MSKLTALAPQVAALAPIVGYAPDVQGARLAYRKASDPCQSWYTSRKWRALRWQVLTDQLFTCQRCQRVVVPASEAICDHVVPHRGSPRLFWDRSNLQCLCKPCHDSVKQREERAHAT